MTQGTSRLKISTKVTGALSLTALLFLFSCSSDPDGMQLPDGKWMSERVDGGREILDFDGHTLKSSFDYPGEEPIADKDHVEPLSSHSYTASGDTLYYRVSPDDKTLYVYNDSTDYAGDIPVDVYQRVD